MHSWQTLGAVSRVSLVSPVRRGATASGPLDVVDDDVQRLGTDVGHALEIVGDATLDIGSDCLDVRAVVDDDVHFDLVPCNPRPSALLRLDAAHLGGRV